MFRFEYEPFVLSQHVLKGTNIMTVQPLAVEGDLQSIAFPEFCITDGIPLNIAFKVFLIERFCPLLQLSVIALPMQGDRLVELCRNLFEQGSHSPIRQPVGHT